MGKYILARAALVLDSPKSTSGSLLLLLLLLLFILKVLLLLTSFARAHSKSRAILWGSEAKTITSACTAASNDC